MFKKQKQIVEFIFTSKPSLDDSLCDKEGWGNRNRRVL